MSRLRIFSIGALALLLSLAAWPQDNLPPDPSTAGNVPSVGILVSPQHPMPSDVVGLEIIGRPTPLGDWATLRSATLLDRLVIVQIGLRPSPAASLTDRALPAPWKLHLDLGRLERGPYQVMVFVNGRLAAHRDFFVGQAPEPRPRLSYHETGGLIGLDNHLVVMPDGPFKVHWLVLGTTTNSGISGPPGYSGCEGRLNNEQMGRLAHLFAQYGFADWAPVYGMVPTPTEALPQLPVPDGRVWRITWEGKTVHVFEGGELPDRVVALITQLSAFAMNLARHCPPPPPPPLRGEIRSVSPPHPSTTDVIAIVVGGDFPDPSYHVTGKEIMLVNREIRFRIKVERDPDGPVITVIQPWEEKGETGPLAAGPWVVLLEINGHVVAMRHLLVQPAPGAGHDVIVLVFPEIPHASAPVALEILGVFHEPRRIAEHSWSQENQTFHVTIASTTALSNTYPGLVETDPAGVVIPWRVREELGILPAGQYQVVVRLDGNEVAGKTFTVQPAPTLGEHLSGAERAAAVDVNDSGRVDYADLLRLIRFWHVE